MLEAAVHGWVVCRFGGCGGSSTSWQEHMTEEGDHFLAVRKQRGGEGLDLRILVKDMLPMI